MSGICCMGVVQDGTSYLLLHLLQLACSGCGLSLQQAALAPKITFSGPSLQQLALQSLLSADGLVAGSLCCFQTLLQQMHWCMGLVITHESPLRQSFCVLCPIFRSIQHMTAHEQSVYLQALHLSAQACQLVQECCLVSRPSLALCSAG